VPAGGSLLPTSGRRKPLRRNGDCSLAAEPPRQVGTRILIHTLKPGRHVHYEKETPMTNLYLMLLDRMGVRQESIGDSTGNLEQLAEL